MESRFARFVALLLVAGVFYVGHGLHQGRDVEFPAMVSQLQAADITSVHPGSPSGNYGNFFVVTSSNDNREIHIWKIGNSTGKATFVGSSQVTPQPGAPMLQPMPEVSAPAHEAVGAHDHGH